MKKIINSILISNCILINAINPTFDNVKIEKSISNNSIFTCNDKNNPKVINQTLNDFKTNFNLKSNQNFNVDIDKNWIRLVPEKKETFVLSDWVDCYIDNNDEIQGTKVVYGYLTIFTNCYYVETDTEILNLVMTKMVVTPNYSFGPNETNELKEKNLFWPLSMTYQAQGSWCKDLSLHDYEPKVKNPEASVSYGLNFSLSIGTDAALNFVVCLFHMLQCILALKLLI